MVRKLLVSEIGLLGKANDAVKLVFLDTESREKSMFDLSMVSEIEEAQTELLR